MPAAQHPARSPARLRLRHHIRVLGVLLLAACGPGGPTEVAFGDQYTRLLFIGNSLTYGEDVPGLVRAIAEQAGDTAIRTASVAYADFALEDHWAEGTALRRLEDSRWEFVVMQQGPSSLPQNQQHLAYWAGQFAPRIRAAGAKPVLYQVWPHISRLGDYPNTRVSYANAARQVDGVFAPAGAAWSRLLSAAPALSPYSADGLHANRLGAYLAAIVLYARIRGVEPESLPPQIPGAVGVDSATVRLLQSLAAQAIDEAKAEEIAPSTGR